jgi:NodT family efflux transporter outer membrane factor (OMF) lipoprotein
MRRLAALLGLVALAGCEVGPTYRAPKMATPQSFVEQAQVPAAEASAADLSRWWAQFGDPELDALIGRALRQNLDLATAVSRVREARAQIVVARAAELPSVSASAVGARLRQGGLLNSNGAPSGGGGGAGGTGGAAGSTATSGGGVVVPNKLYSVGGDASWQIDLFGGARRGVEAARAQAEAAVWQARDSQVSLTAEVARAYFSLRLAQARKAEAEADIARIRDLLGLVGARFRVGINTDLDVNQQRAALTARLAEVPQLDQQIRAATHALAALLDEPTAKLQAELARSVPLPPSPGRLPVGLPSDLLRRRPDLRAAERQLAAATAQEGQAIAALYPKLDLLALASFAGQNLGTLFANRNLSVIGLGYGSWNVFAGGRLRATVRERKEQVTQAELAYRQAIIGAMKDVEDALSAYAADSQREARVAENLRVSRDSSTLAGRRYGVGITDFTDVLNAEGQVNSAEDQLLSARGAAIDDLVSLYTALGGGWSAAAAPPTG